MRPWGSLAAIVLLGSTAVSPPSLESREDLSRDEARKLKSGAPYTETSLAQGHTLFVRTCATCHGLDGRAQVDVIANATDLTTPKLYNSGTSDGEIFRSIRDGAGPNLTMPPFRSQYSKEDDIWHLVNYIRSLWPEDARPLLQPDAATSNKKQ